MAQPVSAGLGFRSCWTASAMRCPLHVSSRCHGHTSVNFGRHWFAQRSSRLGYCNVRSYVLISSRTTTCKQVAVFGAGTNSDVLAIRSLRSGNVRRFGDTPNLSEAVQRRLEAFRERLDDPDHMWISGGDARRKYGLQSTDLQELRRNALVKDSAYNASVVTRYFLPDVIQLAKQRLGQELIEAHYLRYVIKEENRIIKGRIYDGSKRELVKPYWYSGPSTATVEGRKSVQQGLISNALICFVKTGVWLYTGSHAIFADLMHSTADVANYGYRLMQLSRSLRSDDIMHPYGYAPLRYITADRSFVILGGLGGAVPLTMGCMELFHLLQGGASTAMTADLILASASIFLVSMALEGVAMQTAYKEILAQSATMMPASQLETTPDWRRCYLYIREGPDVMSVATFCEAGSGVIGAMVGLCGLGLSWYLESIIWDVGASLFMSSIVGGVSMFLLSRSGAALLGRTLPMDRVESIVKRLEERTTVVTVYDVKTEVLGVDTVRFKAEVQFNPEAITERMLGVMNKDSMSCIAWGVEEQPQGVRIPRVPEQVASRLQDMMPQLHKGLNGDAVAAQDWLCANNAIFYEALAWELKRMEMQIKDDLKEFRNVHIDLEPW